MKKVTQEQILEVYHKYPTMSYKDMAKILNCSKPLIQYWFRKLGIVRDRIQQQKINNTGRNKIFVIPDNAKDILIGTLLGDSSVTKYYRDCESVKILNSSITCGHSFIQKNYVLYIKECLEKEGVPSYYKENSKKSCSVLKGRTIVCNGRCDLTTIRNISFNYWRDLWYPNGVKIVPKSIINNFTERSLAFWYMDDGSKIGKKNHYYVLHTEGFTIEDVQYLQEILFTLFSIKTVIHYLRKKPVIYIKSCSTKQFTKLIKPYICPSMLYKLILNGSE